MRAVVPVQFGCKGAVPALSATHLASVLSFSALRVIAICITTTTYCVSGRFAIYKWHSLSVASVLGCVHILCSPSSKYFFHLQKNADSSET